MFSSNLKREPNSLTPVEAPLAEPTINDGVDAQTTIIDRMSEKLKELVKGAEESGQPGNECSQTEETQHENLPTHSGDGDANTENHSSQNIDANIETNNNDKNSQVKNSNMVKRKPSDVKEPLPWQPLSGLEKVHIVLDTWEKLDVSKVEDQNMCVQTTKELSQTYWKEKDLREEVAALLIERKWPVKAHESLKVITKAGLFSSDPVWFSSYYILNAMWNYSDSSLEFAKKLHDADVLSTMKSYMTHQPFLQALVSSKNIFYVVKAALSITHNVSRAPDVVATYKQLNIPEAVRPFLRENSHTNDEFLQALSGLILANVSEDGDDLSDTEKIIDFIVKCMKKAQEHVRGRFRGFTPTELAHGLAKLTAMDANKFKIVEAGALPVFNIMLQQDDPDQHLSAASALWGLAFDERARDRIQAEPGLLENLEGLLHSKRDDVRKAARGAVWTVKRKLEQRAPIVDKLSDQEGRQLAKDALIFLSYSWGNQEATLKIHKELKKHGHNVWIDVEQMCENLLESMAEGIEAAQLVVMCVSETYKDSPNCRTEAEYSYKLNKPIIPIYLQDGFKATGWLGLILGTKFYYNFAKIQFEEIFPQFHKEVINKLGMKQAAVQEKIVSSVSQPITSSPPSQRASTNPELYTWSHDQVQNWFLQHGLDSYSDDFRGVDGKGLISLYQLKGEAPEYFYHLMETKINFSMTDLLNFRFSLDELVSGKG